MIHNYDRSYEYQGRKIIDCKTCGFKHVFPYFTKEEVQEFYSSKYYHSVKPFPYDEVDDDFIKHKKESVIQSKLYAEIYEKITTLIGTSKKSLLDIGGGNNLLVYYFKNQGWEALSIEPNYQASEYLKKFGLYVFNGMIEDYKTSDKFSFININYVLEHLRKPEEILKQLFELTEPNGIIRVAVPNDFTIQHYVYMHNCNAEPGWVTYPDHINYFTFESLHNLLARVGYHEVYRTTNFPLDLLLACGIDYYNDSFYKENIGKYVKNFEKGLNNIGGFDYKRKLYDKLAEAGFGRVAIIYAIKN